MDDPYDGITYRASDNHTPLLDLATERLQPRSIRADLRYLPPNADRVIGKALCLAGHPTSPVILKKFFREPDLGGTAVVDPNAEWPGSLKAVALGLEEASSRLVPDHRLVREQFAGERKTSGPRDQVLTGDHEDI